VQPPGRRIPPPVGWGAVVGVVMAVSPLAFWWLEPSTVYALGLVLIASIYIGALNVYRAATGTRVGRLPAGPGHWNSPIVAGGRVALPEGDANSHERHGVLNLYSTS
jgi:hypothetical protein